VSTGFVAFLALTTWLGGWYSYFRPGHGDRIRIRILTEFRNIRLTCTDRVVTPIASWAWGQRWVDTMPVMRSGSSGDGAFGSLPTWGWSF
jgi:hypothetical protein